MRSAPAPIRSSRMTAADRLGVRVENVTVELGDTDLPPAPVAGGSNTTASVCNVVAKACDDNPRGSREAAVADARRAVRGRRPGQPDACRSGQTLRDRRTAASEDLDAAIARASPTARSRSTPRTCRRAPSPTAMKMLYAGRQNIVGGARTEGPHSIRFGAEFVEVRVHELTREIRVPAHRRRLCGRPDRQPAHGAQPADGRPDLGHLVGAARGDRIDRAHRPLRQQRPCRLPHPRERRRQRGTWSFDAAGAGFAGERLGIKGLGELGNVGTNAAVANAVYHATGVRVRELPIRLETSLPA